MQRTLEDFLNMVRTTSTKTCDNNTGTIHFEKETEEAATVRELKFGKTALEDEIQPEMLKALTEEVSRLTWVCQVAWKLRKTPKDC